MNLPMDNAQLFGIFVAEARDHLENITQGVLELEKTPSKTEGVAELFRAAHSLKGAASTVGLDDIKEIAHRIEDIFSGVRDGTLRFESTLASTIFAGLDAIREILETILAGKKEKKDISAVLEAIGEVLGGKSEPPKPAAKEVSKEIPPKSPKKIKAKNTGESSSSRKSKAKTRVAPKSGSEESTPTPPEKDKPQANGKNGSVAETGPIEEFIRVPVNKINTLLNLGGELVINKIKTTQKVGAFKRSIKQIKEMQRRLNYFSEKSKELIDPKEHAGLFDVLQRCDLDSDGIREELVKLSDEIMGEAVRVDPIIDELQQQIKKIRMLPCSTIFVGFPRVVRDLASEMNKKVELKIEGGETELDKKVLEDIKDPLIHILRNSVDHGIESPDERTAAGKPAKGTIRLSAFYKGANVVVEIEDDGKGIDVERVKEVAVERGLRTQEEVDNMEEKEIFGMIFLPGFSTSRFITDVSGRGVGMDVLRDRIESLKGNIEVASEMGRGNTIRLELPLTIAIINVLLIRAQEKTFAIPLTGVEEVVKISPTEIHRIENRMAFDLRGHTVPMVEINEVLGIPSQAAAAEDNGTQLNVVIVGSIFGRVGFIVEGLRGKEEIYIKSMGSHVGKLKNVGGATMLGTGEVIVILDPADLVASSRNLRFDGRTQEVQKTAELKEKKRILIVEDSMTTRDMLRSLLESRGHKVTVAVDGLNGMEKLGQGKFDLIVSDIEMPRMSGLEFCQAVKSNDQFKTIPFVFVTALSKEEERRRGIEVGAQAYIVKTGFDQSNLLDTVERLIG